MRKKGYAVDGLNEGEKAKIFYLTHHLGLPDAIRFIENTMTEQRAKYLLELQKNKAFAADKAKKSGGKYLAAHRVWLADYIDSRIELMQFMFDKTKAQTVRGLIPLSESIRKIEKTESKKRKL